MIFIDRSLKGRSAYPYCDADEPVAPNPTQEYLVPKWGNPLLTKMRAAIDMRSISDFTLRFQDDVIDAHMAKVTTNWLYGAVEIIPESRRLEQQIVNCQGRAVHTSCHLEVGTTPGDDGVMTAESRLTFHKNSRCEEASGEVPESNCWLGGSGSIIRAQRLVLVAWMCSGNLMRRKRELTNQPVQRETPPRNRAS
jgi:hypothetical protein